MISEELMDGSIRTKLKSRKLMPQRMTKMTFKYRLYHAVAGYMTRYIPRERARSSEVEEAPRAKPEALPRLYESASPFPRDRTGHTSRYHVI